MIMCGQLFFPLRQSILCMDALECKTNSYFDSRICFDTAQTDKSKSYLKNALISQLNGSQNSSRDHTSLHESSFITRHFPTRDSTKHVAVSISSVEKPLRFIHSNICNSVQSGDLLDHRVAQKGSFSENRVCAFALSNQPRIKKMYLLL